MMQKICYNFRYMSHSIHLNNQYTYPYNHHNLRLHSSFQFCHHNFQRMLSYNSTYIHYCNGLHILNYNPLFD